MGRIVHFEIPSDQPEKSMSFFKTVFNWTFQKWGDQEYWIAVSGDKDTMGINGALMKRQEYVQSVVNTIAVAKIDETIKAISDNGGIMLTQVMDIPAIGKFAYFKDPDGNTFGVIEPTGNM